jgi:thiol-disulfide isomerase/thioredoxin
MVLAAALFLVGLTLITLLPEKPNVLSQRARIILAFAALASFITVGAASWVIFGNSTPHASAEGAACREKPQQLNNLQLATTPRPLPDAVLLKDGTIEIALTEYAGRALVMNFWATWCAPCIREMPALNRLSAGASSSVVVLPVSQDREGGPIVRKFLDVNKLTNLPALIDPKGQLARALKVTNLPTTVLFSRQGREIGRLVGIAEWDQAEVRRYLRRCLNARR